MDYEASEANPDGLPLRLVGDLSESMVNFAICGHAIVHNDGIDFVRFIILYFMSLGQRPVLWKADVKTAFTTGAGDPAHGSFQGWSTVDLWEVHR